MRRRSETVEPKKPAKDAKEPVSKSKKEQIAETSRALKDELDKADDEGVRSGGFKPDVEPPKLATDLQRIVTRTFDMPDVDKVIADSEEWLQGIKPSRCDYGVIADQLDRAQDMARECMRALVNVRLALDQFDVDAQLTTAGMRDYSYAKLQGQKDKGQRSKAITDADVAAQMAVDFPDEYQAVERTKAQAKRTREYLEDLVDRLRERARDLRALTGTARG